MANNIIVKKKRKGACFSCGRVNEKKAFVGKTIMRNRVYVCPGCGMNNSDCIFKELRITPKKQLIFGEI